MKIYNSINEYTSKVNEYSVVTTGTFDGVHLGHRKILERIVDIARKKKMESVLLTFHPHPRTVLFPDDRELRFLTTMEERVPVLKEIGIGNLIIQPFTKELSRVPALEFVRDILIDRLHLNTLVIGHDHHFGRNREGSASELRDWSPLFGFDVIEIDSLQFENRAISSTKIRMALQDGEVDVAATCLGYTYSISATVVKGSGIGTSALGYPTANLEPQDALKLLPADGIYAVQVEYEGKPYKGMLNIGFNPTIEGKGRSIEVHIFDFSSTIYGKNLRVYFHKRIRDEKKFKNLAELKNQLDKDKMTVLNELS
jgi:riboflavin kinase / FMN adenylyltransferase